jgi:hypothetical protein
MQVDAFLVLKAAGKVMDIASKNYIITLNSCSTIAVTLRKKCGILR